MLANDLRNKGSFLARMSVRWGLLAVLVCAGGGLVGCQGENAGTFFRRLDRSDNWVGALVDPLQPPSPSQAAQDMFNVYDADARRKGVAMIAGSSFGGEEPYVRAYRLLVDDPDPTVRGAVAHALGLHGDTTDAPDLTRMLADPSPYVRWEAAKALQKIHDPQAATPLVEMLQEDENADARQAAAYALGQYPQVPVFDALVGSLNDLNYGVADSSSRSLYLITGTYEGTDSGKWVQWAEEHRGAIFANQQLYTYEGYPGHKPFFWWLTPWKDYGRPDPMVPVGLDRSALEEKGPPPAPPTDNADDAAISPENS